MKGHHLSDPNAPNPLNEYQAKQLLSQYDIPVVDEQVIEDIDQAVAAAKAIGYPVVLKALGAKLLHKTEKGLVHLHLKDARAVGQAAKRIFAAAKQDLEGILVQPQIDGQRELMAGVAVDPQFGPVVQFGLGGVMTEALDDVVVRLAPLSLNEALEMTEEIRASKALDDFRGEQAVDRQTLATALVRLSQLALEHPEIVEIDINPLKVTPRGDILAVDALMVVRPPSKPVPSRPPVPAADIGALFHPKSIAFVGASSQLGKWGHMLPVNTISGGYAGQVHLVNPKGGTIAGRPVYPSVLDIPHTVDLAVVTIPAVVVIDLIPQLKAKGIRYMVLISSGFGEVDAAGRSLELKLVAAAQQAGILMLGPNTMGITNPHIHLFCTGSPVTPRPGGTAVVAQSGNMGTQLLAFAEQQDIGIRCFAGSGNEAMIAIEDYLEGFEIDAKTRTVMLYVESVKNGRRFYKNASRLSRKKPIVLLKGGQTEAGQHAAASHTGAMMNDSRIFDAMCQQSGIIQVDQSMQLLDMAAALSSLPLPQGPRVAIMTWGGGWGVVTADLCQAQGLTVPILDPEIVKAIDKHLPAYWSRANPVDLVGDPDPATAIAIMELLTQWKGCDAVINLGIVGRRILFHRHFDAVQHSDPTVSEDFLEQARQFLDQSEKDFITATVKLMETTTKPILGVSLLTDPQAKTVYRIAGSPHNGVYYPTPERAVTALSKMVEYQEYLRRSSAILT